MTEPTYLSTDELNPLLSVDLKKPLADKTISYYENKFYLKMSIIIIVILITLSAFIYYIVSKHNSVYAYKKDNKNFWDAICN